METMQPTVSVVLAVHNGEKYLRDTLESIASQTLRDWECVVINDDSTDGTSAILAEFSERDPRFKVHVNEVNLKLARSLNKGLSLAEGKYVIRMDADDICLPNRFERQVSFMEENADVDVSCCKFFTLCENEIRLGACGRRCDAAAVSAMLLLFNPVIHPGVIAKTDVIRRFGYIPERTCSEDLDIWTRMVSGGKKIAVQNEYLLLYRLHAGQITATTNTKQRVEVVGIQKTFYTENLWQPDDGEMEFYIDHIYFRDQKDLDGVYRFYRKMLKANRKTKAFAPEQITYAFVEILADCRRKFGFSKVEIGKMLRFGGLRFTYEGLAKKKRAREDIDRAIRAAASAGFPQKSSDGIMPVFSFEKGVL